MPAAIDEQQPVSLSALVSAAFAADRASVCAAPPCFHWTACRQQAVVEKAGRSVCRRCADSLRGVEYPLRTPSADSLYASDQLAAEALDMIEKPIDRANNRSHFNESPVG